MGHECAQVVSSVLDVGFETEGDRGGVYDLVTLGVRVVTPGVRDRWVVNAGGGWINVHR